MPQLEAWCLHNFNPKAGHNKFYVVRIDKIGSLFCVVAAWGSVTRPKAQAEQTKAEFADIQQARRLCEHLLGDKISNGYLRLEWSSYHDAHRWQEVQAEFLAKVDMSRCVGAATPDLTYPPSARPLRGKTKSNQAAPTVERDRARRVVNI
jgi:hypothetical protein